MKKTYQGHSNQCCSLLLLILYVCKKRMLCSLKLHLMSAESVCKASTFAFYLKHLKWKQKSFLYVQWIIYYTFSCKCIKNLPGTLWQNIYTLMSSEFVIIKINYSLLDGNQKIWILQLYFIIWKWLNTISHINCKWFFSKTRKKYKRGLVTLSKIS